MRLGEIAPGDYARDVLPLTAPLWAGRRSFDEYAAQTIAIARTPYGRRHYRTVGLLERGALLASFKRYERTIREGPRRIRAVGFGAVFTPPELRGRGYASVMLAMALDLARAEGFDVAYLFSDIRPQFYAALGFRTLPSRKISLRADSLPSKRLEVARLGDADWNGVRHVFELCDGRRTASFARTATTWSWIEERVRRASEHADGHQTNLVVRRRGVYAYVLGMRVPKRDAYVVDEYGYADDRAAAVLPALLRAAAGDLRRIVGWLPPSGARELLPACSVRKRTRAILMMTPLRPSAEALVSKLCASAARADFCWATDHI